MTEHDRLKESDLILAVKKLRSSKPLRTRSGYLTRPRRA